jgi:predicted transcriptional regulator of viral defense system
LIFSKKYNKLILTGDNVPKDHLTLMHELRDYASPKARLTRMIRSGEVIQVRRGIFLEAGETNYSLKSLASIIYGPSYISFEYALAHYGLIPERAQAVTSAVYNKNKNRCFHTSLGNFYYYYLPTTVYPYDIVLGSEDGQSYLIATREKALCDTLYKIRGIESVNTLQTLLFEDWRMESEAVLALDRACIAFLAPLYRKKILWLLLKWLEGETNNA